MKYFFLALLMLTLVPKEQTIAIHRYVGEYKLANGFGIALTTDNK